VSVGTVIKRIRNVDRYLSRRIGERRRILVDAVTPMNLAVIDPVVRALRDDSRVDIYFTSSKEPDKLPGLFDDISGRWSKISPRRAAMFRFDAYIAADQMWATLPRGAPRVFMFHGVAGKYADVYDRPSFSMRQWDRIFFINRRRLENFINAGAIDADSKSARLIGYPKLDCLVDGSLDRDRIVTSLGLDPSRKVVLYAPTWSPYSSLNKLGEDLVQRLCRAGFQVIVKLHDRSLQPDYEFSGGIDWAARLEPVLHANGGRFARDRDATPFLAASDVMVTDHSSAGFEYLLLDRPLIRIDVPELITETRIPPEYVSLLADASTSVRTVAEAADAVERSLADPTASSASRKAVADELFFDPGTATARAVRELYDVMELDPLSIERESVPYRMYGSKA
jgi:CDP-glycerol glycerophosphotransferase (TagB/SpsB family)